MLDNGKCCHVFIAYKGTEISSNKIAKKLEKLCPHSYTVKIEKANKNVIFAKIVNEYDYYSEPDWIDFYELLSVSGYNQQELEAVVINLYAYMLGYSRNYYKIFNSTYKEKGTGMFKYLKEYIHFCSVIYDRVNDSLIAGITVPNSKYNHLYYGYTKINHEIIYSNLREALESFVMK